MLFGLYELGLLGGQLGLHRDQLLAELFTHLFELFLQCHTPCLPLLGVVHLGHLVEITQATLRPSTHHAQLPLQVLRQPYLPLIPLIDLGVLRLQLVDPIPLHGEQLRHLCGHKFTAILLGCVEKDIALADNLRFKKSILLYEFGDLTVFQS